MEKQVICFGEVLWDVFDNGKQPGGAPLNIAAHLKQLGVVSQVVSKIGRDPLADEMVQFFNSLGLSTQYLQQDAKWPTGTVTVQLDNPHEAQYDIQKPAAWDYIGLDPEASRAAAHADMLIFGTLASRSVVSQQTLAELVKMARFNVFDVNLRKPHYSKQIIAELASFSQLMKVNEEEFGLLVEDFCIQEERLLSQMKALSELFGLEMILLTRGANGAVVFDGHELYEHPGFHIKVQNTVGSGDAFLAGFLVELLKQAPIPKALAFGNAVGAFVATRDSATPALDQEEILRIIASRPH